MISKAVCTYCSLPRVSRPMRKMIVGRGRSHGHDRPEWDTFQPARVVDCSTGLDTWPSSDGSGADKTRTSARWLSREQTLAARESRVVFSAPGGSIRLRREVAQIPARGTLPSPQTRGHRRRQTLRGSPQAVRGACAARQPQIAQARWSGGIWIFDLRGTEPGRVRPVDTGREDVDWHPVGPSLVREYAGELGRSACLAPVRPVDD